MNKQVVGRDAGLSRVEALTPRNALCRNCDVGTAEEQSARFEAYCNNEVCNRKNCGFSCRALYSDKCAFEWAQMPYESEVRK